MSDQRTNQKLPVIFIGWVVPLKEGAETVEKAQLTMKRLHEHLIEVFPMFDWKTELITRRLTRESRQQDPLQLLQVGVQEKVARSWDFALVASSSELKARSKPFIIGVPSSALETGVVSLQLDVHSVSAEIDPAAVARFLLASMLGLGSKEAGAMRPPNPSEDYQLNAFSDLEKQVIEERLRDIGDERLEECGKRWNRITFRLRTFLADPKGILLDVVGYRPWWQPFRLDRLTAAAMLSSLLSFLGAEVWELGVGVSPVILGSGTIVAIWASAWFLKKGQHLSDFMRSKALSEQVVRTEWVLSICLLMGMTALWCILWAVSFGIASLLPREVIEGWVDTSLDLEARARFAVFVSTLGTLAGALGGNLEDEGEFKARFYFDEEI